MSKTRVDRVALFAFLAMAMTLGVTGLAAEEGATSRLLLVLDASGSMWGQIEGENKIVIARRVLADLVTGLDDATETGVIAYGHRREGDCEDIETVVPLGALDKPALIETVNALNPKGKTPITRSLEQAFDAVRGQPGGATVVLISDGLETCDGDPCAAVRAAKESGIEFILHVVGFDVAGEDLSSLECAAQAGDGLFRSAENADQLASALEDAVALPIEVPPGRLSVKVVADGKLHDAAVNVSHADSGEEAGGGRTYASPETNPRLIPLAGGKYDVEVGAIGIKGAPVRRFAIEIAGDEIVEKLIDYSTGELSIGVTRNGELSDATYSVRDPDSGEEVARGRTYVSASSNPATKRIISGTYDVSVKSVEIKSAPMKDLGRVTVEPGGKAEVAADFESGTLRIGAAREGALIDATVSIVDVATGKSAASGRTYVSEKSNPKAFILEPGEYRVRIQEIRGERKELTVNLGKGETVERIVDPAAP